MISLTKPPRLLYAEEGGMKEGRREGKGVVLWEWLGRVGRDEGACEAWRGTDRNNFREVLFRYFYLQFSHLV